jgi:hypothetical protein
MKVSYSRLYSLGNFENEKIECEDDVRDDELYATAYERVRGIVEAQHVATMAARSVEQKSRENLYELNSFIAKAEARAKEVNGHWRRAVKTFNQVRGLLLKHGVVIEELEDYLLPPEPKPEPVEEQFVSGDEDDEYCPVCGYLVNACECN